ncbi:MAG: helix-turn-helix transcriptional regulator [Promethearchaeota archaeon]
MKENHSKIQVKTLTKFFILTLLKSKESVTGYHILKRLEKDFEKTTSPTHVYDFLKSLESEGFVKRVPNPKSKRGKGFKLTPSGMEFVDRIFSRFENLIDVAIQSKLKICSSCGVKLYDEYHVENMGGKAMNFCCRHCAKAYKKAHDIEDI